MMDESKPTPELDEEFKDISDSIIKTVGKVMGRERVNIQGKGKAYSEVTQYIPTSSSLLDIIIRNPKNGNDSSGIPVGRLTEIQGQEATGKSLMAGHIMANTQRMGGVPIFINTEHRLSNEFFRAIGVDLNRLINFDLEAVSEVFEAIEMVIEKVRETSTDKLVVIVWDSVAGTSTKEELDGKYEDYTIGLHARRIAQGMRKLMPQATKENIALVFTNQLKTKIGAVMFGEQFFAFGGKAIPYHSSIRIRLTKAGKIKDAKKNVIGENVQAKIIKNDIGPPYRICKFPVFFSYGVDDERSIFNWLKDTPNGFVKHVAKGNYKFTKKLVENLEIKNFDFAQVIETTESKLFTERNLLLSLKKNRDFKAKITDFIANELYVPYRTSEMTDEVEVDEDIDE